MCVFISKNAHSQQISFKPLAGNTRINVTHGYPSTLYFDYLLIDTEMSRSISLESADAAWLEIEAPAYYDITVDIDWETPTYQLQNIYDPNATIPFNLKFAYANQGEANVSDAKSNATVLPDGFFSITIPVNRRSGGLPPPPPTPEFFGYDAPTSKVWLFFFGETGPVNDGHMVSTGTYIANINVNIYFSFYDE